MRYELLRWTTYRRIRHPQMVHFVWTVPIASAVLITIVFFSAPTTPEVLGRDGLAATVVSVFSVLTGFFIAALAAVATFQAPGMDVDMPRPAPKVPIRVDGVINYVSTTRRMFLSYVFSYLFAAAIALVLSLAVLNLFSKDLQGIGENVDIFGIFEVGSIYFRVLFVLFVLFVFYVVSSIVVTALHGLSFITERLSRPY